MAFLKRAYHSLPAPLRRITKSTLLQLGAALNLIPDGTHIFFDVKRRLKHEKFEVFFDIGANVGQTIRQFLTEFPAAHIHAFEPDPDNFRRLRQNVAGNRQVEIYNFALSSKAGRLRFDNTYTVTEMRRLAPNQDDHTLPFVEVRTLDEFCAEKRIQRIDFLKVDTEGHDLEAIIGGRGMIENSEIGLIVAECSMNSDNPSISSYFDVYNYLDRSGYRLFGIYEQFPGIYSGRPQLRRANCAFISPKVIARNPYHEE